MKLTLVLALCVCFCSGGCDELTAPDELDAEGLDATVNGKTVVCPEREKFTLQLDSWADAGYRWDCEISDTLVVGMLGQPTYRQKDLLISKNNNTFELLMMSKPDNQK